jgi:hypothetical protein
LQLEWRKRGLSPVAALRVHHRSPGLKAKSPLPDKPAAGSAINQL